LAKILWIRQGSHCSLARQAVLDHGGARQLGELAGIRELEIILPWGWASLRGLFPFGDGIQKPADHPWLGKEGDSLHPAGALGAFQNVDAKHHLEQLSPWGPAAVGAFFGIVAQDAACL
jgi:hypothetical protein